jgi:cytochrome c-type biogenesis protein CcmF
MLGITVFAVAALLAWEDRAIRVANWRSLQVGIHDIEPDWMSSTRSGQTIRRRRRHHRVPQRARLGRFLREKRIYPVAQMPTTEAGIRNGILRDVYVVLGDPQTAVVNSTYIKPLANTGSGVARFCGVAASYFAQ